MKKGDIIKGTVTDMDFPDRGILIADGRRVTVKGALPGQQIEAVMTRVRRDRCEARLLNVTERSEKELDAPSCPHASRCGGCAFRSLPYEEQLILKEGEVRKILSPMLPEENVFEGIKASPLTEGYRNKMEFSFGDEVKDGPITLGLHAKGSFYDIITVDKCRLVHGDVLLILAATLGYMREQGASYFRKISHTGYLRHLLVRRGIKTGGILVDLITSTQTENGWEQDISESEFLDGWKERLLALPIEGTYAGILHTRNDREADVIEDDGTDTLYGCGYFYEELLGLRFKITPFSFFQTNSSGAEVLYSTAREYTGDTKGQNVFDLYSGTGTIAQILAPAAGHVTGVEIVPEAVSAARENAEMNGLSNCDFIAGDVLKVLDEIEERPDIIVLDPPRDGVHPKALPKIIAYGVSRIIYISCKPTSLARDLVTLRAGGYEPVRVCCIDQFPYTSQVETIALLQKR